MKWGKAVYIHGYLDTQLFIDLCKRLADTGLKEAAAPAIVD